MILYRLGLSSDAFSISSVEILIVIASFSLFFILGIFTAANLSESSYPDNRIDEFLQDHKLLTFVISLAFAAIAAFSMFLFAEMMSTTAPNTIVESRYILDNSTRDVELKDDFKTVYTNEENVEFSSILSASNKSDLPEDLRQALKSGGVFKYHLMSSDSDKDFTIFSTKEDMTYQQIAAMRSLSEYKHVIAINASKADSSVKISATIDSVELTKEEDNEENMTYRIDKIEMANAVETISRDSQSKSRDIKSVKLHISGKTSESAKARKSIEKLVE